MPNADDGDDQGRAGGWLRRLLGGGRGEPQLPAGTLVDRDVPYGRRPAHRLDIYRRPAAAPAPVLVLVHGGGWAIGDKAGGGFVGSKVGHWVEQGWVVVSVNYRLPPWGGPAEQASDVAHAIAAVQAQVARWGGDGARVAVLAHSSGAHLAALAMADAQLGTPFGLRPVQRAVLIDGAALDVVQMMQGPHLPLHERAFGTDAARWPALSPWHCLAAAPPPLLLVCSSERAESQVQSQRFAARAREYGGDVDLLALPLGHAELNRSLGADNELTRAVDAFLQPLAEPAG